MFSSEYANQNAYDSIQIHGGSGFMKDYACERIYRDARILTIYEGTSQLQTVAAIPMSPPATTSDKSEITKFSRSIRSSIPCGKVDCHDRFI